MVSKNAYFIGNYNYLNKKKINFKKFSIYFLLLKFKYNKKKKRSKMILKSIELSPFLCVCIEITILFVCVNSL
jgi:hypothetical protein